MNKFLTHRWTATAFATLLFVLASNTGALACAACFGDTTGSKQGNAAAIGIGAMVVIMLVMLGALTAAGFHLAWRAKNPLPDYDELLGDEPPASGPQSGS
jgi:hypothetical protein